MPEKQRIGENRRIEIDRHQGCRIVIRRPADPEGCWHGFWMVILWLFGELVGICALLTKLSRQTLPGAPSFSLVLALMIGWTLLGWVVLHGVRLTLPAEEVLAIQKDTFVVTRTGLMVDDVRSYPLAMIRDLRYSPLWDEVTFSDRNGPRELGNIRFDVGDEPHYFGAGLTARDCRRLIEVLEKEFGMPGAEV